MEHTHRFFNGLEVCLAPSSTAPLVSIQIWVRAGSNDENAGEEGAAHFLEHMLFKGTPHYPTSGDITKKVDDLGCEINAYTTFDRTVYYLAGPKDALWDGLNILWSMVGHSLLDSQELTREKEVVIEEIRRGRDNPNALLSQEIFRRLYAGTPMGRPVIGYEETVAAMDRDLLHGFYKRWYTLNNMALVVSGEFDPQELLNRLPQWLDGIPAQNLPRAPWPRKVDPQWGVWLKKGPYQEARVQLALASPPLEHPRAAAWEVMTSILGQGDACRLSLQVQDEQQLVTSINCGVFLPHGPVANGFGALGFYGRGELAVAALQASVRELMALAETKPGKDELSRTMSALQAERLYARESVEGVARTLGTSLLTAQKLQFEEHFMEQLAGVTAADVQSAAQDAVDALAQGHYALGVVASADFRPSQEELAAALAQVLRPSSAAPTTPWAPLASAHSPQVQQMLLECNGRTLEVNLRVGGQLPLVSALLGCSNGLLTEPLELVGLNGALAQMLTRGTLRQSYRSFVTELEDGASSLGAFSTKDLFGIRLDALSQWAPRTFDMLLDCISHPAFLDEEWAKVQRETQEVLTSQKDNPSALLGKISGPLLFGDHPYGRPTMGTPETVAAITPAAIKGQWHRLLQSPRWVLSLTGQVDHWALVEKWLRVVEKLPPLEAPGAGATTDHTPPPLGGGHRWGFHELEREQAHITLSFRAVPLSSPLRLPLELAAHILGGHGGRLFMDLRDTQSLAYSVGANQTPLRWAGAFSLYIGTAATKTKEAIGGLQHHVEKLAQEPPSPEELARTARSLLGSYHLDSQHHSYQASQLAMSSLYGLPYDHFLTFGERLSAVTPQEVSQALKTIVSQNPPVLAVVGPAGTWHPQENLNWTV